MFLLHMIIRLGVVKSTLIITTFSSLVSFLIYLITALFIAPIRPIGVVVSLLAPLIAAPLGSIVLVKIAKSLYRAQEEVLEAKKDLEEKIADRTQELSAANKHLVFEIQARKESEERLAKLNEIFLGFGTDPVNNINLLVAFCGEVLGATCALYNRLQGGMLCTLGQWNTPSDFKPVDHPEGHLCYDIIKSQGDSVWVIGNLQDSTYAQTDPNVQQYHLQTYIGKPVKFGDTSIGALCVVFQHDVIPSDNDKYFMGIIASAIGIEERRRNAEEEMQRSEARFRSLLQNVSTVAVQGYTLDGTTTYWNQASERLYGYSAQEAIEQNLVDIIIPPEMREEVKLAMRQMAETRQPIQASELSLMRKDGSRVAVFSSHAVVQIPGHDPELFCIDIDLTERKLMEEALRESEEKYRRLYTTMMDAFACVDMTGRFVETNNSFNTMIGYSSDELLQLTFNDITVAKWHSCESEIINEQVMVLGFSDVYNKEYRRKDGTVFPVELRTFLITDKNGQPVGMWAIVRDITERKRIEAENIRTHQLESLGVLAGGIAHDFNNLMTVILGNIELAMMGLPTDHSSYPLLRAALQSVEHTSDLTGRLITFAKGGFSVKQEIDISGVLQETVREVVKKTAAQVSFEIEKDLWPVKADEAQIRQAFNSLAVNALEAMDGRGVLTIRAQNVEVHYEDGLPLKEGSYLRIIFVDKGRGIAEKDLAFVFDPYFTTKNMGDQKGTGLGLSICFSILKKHNGHITVTSTIGEGATFTIYLPALAEEAKETIHPFPSFSSRVLIMEDESDVRRLEKGFLEKMGYEVTEARDGQEAFNCYKEALRSNNPFHLVILDLVVRYGLGGQQTIEMLLKEDPYVRAIIASGYMDEPVIEHYKDYGFQGRLKKPFRFLEFEDVIKKVRGQETFEDGGDKNTH